MQTLQNITNSQKYKYPAFIFLGALFLMFDAFYNRYPLLYSDTSTYLASGFELETPFDRPITYGIFLRLSSLNGISLWFTVFFQALLTSFLIFKTTRSFVRAKYSLNISLLLILGLSLLTGLSWTVCQVMPDIFTPIALLSVIIIISESDNKKNIPFYFIFWLSAAMHISHLLLFGSFFLLILLFRKRLSALSSAKLILKRTAVLLILLISTIITMGSALSKSRHIFFMGAMAEHGILKEYLNENCSSHHYKLCTYKDSIPQYAYQFVWEKYSPLYKLGTWKDVKPEFEEIINSTLSQPKYIKMHITASIKATADQLRKFRINDGNGSFGYGTTLFERIKKYIPADVKAYSSSLQIKKEFAFTNSWNIAYTVIIILCPLALIFLSFRFTFYLNTQNGKILLLFLLGIIVNAWACGTFANAIDRLGCKMIWLVPFGTAIAIINTCERKRNQN